ncbi:hypothetical protein [Nocardioides daphniae]|uniref:Glycosyltransferase RgtA/B/C/D-like domain-containing protein n=1 Tax=Nocardioides daphniae TaxID=402297 RepID=A0A4P7UDN6_9ACTN|nr:hypothetical protein [Nocardioides daphniae]QCC77964.1 hypothetical protein E2C04_13635 [Nocardioides daphniae]GGD23552.1 hypothetical protein GCM10007231_23340 [Nocardioides daphniae]
MSESRPRLPSAVWAAALAAVVGRACGLLWPLRPDEAGYLLAARAWDPRPDELFHPYFVDRPPSLRLLVRLTDAAAGPYGLRGLAALGAGVAVLLAAVFVRELVRWADGPLHEDAQRRVLTQTAWLTAAFLVTAQVDAVAAKGELLGVPLVLASAVLALRAFRARSTWRAAGWAAAAGLVAMSATGLKQSLLGGLVFGAVLLVAAVATRRVRLRTLLVLGAAAAVGAAVPVLATVAGTWAVGTDLGSLENAVVDFREDASKVMFSGLGTAPATRALLLLLVFTTTGMALVLARSLLRLPTAWRRLTAPALAATGAVAVDLAAAGLSGNFWTSYLFALVPSLVMLWACTRVAELASRGTDGAAKDRAGVVVALCVASSALSLAGWIGVVWGWGDPPQEYVLGREIARVATPGDTLTVYGGRADVQWASGLDSPYAHLWSLPMRTADRDLSDLRALLDGPDAPTWLVEAVSPHAWDDLGARHLGDVVARRYTYVGTFCDDMVVRRHVDAPAVAPLHPDCRTPWGRR